MYAYKQQIQARPLHAVPQRRVVTAPKPVVRKKVKAKKKIKQELSNELKELISDMQRVLGTKVNAIGNDKKGRIYIDYYTRDDLDRISDIIEMLKKEQR